MCLLLLGIARSIPKHTVLAKRIYYVVRLQVVILTIKRSVEKIPARAGLSDLSGLFHKGQERLGSCLFSSVITSRSKEREQAKFCLLSFFLTHIIFDAYDSKTKIEESWTKNVIVKCG